jgi:hypothetical protein
MKRRDATRSPVEAWRGREGGREGGRKVSEWLCDAWRGTRKRGRGEGRYRRGVESLPKGLLQLPSEGRGANYQHAPLPGAEDVQEV